MSCQEVTKVESVQGGRLKSITMVYKSHIESDIYLEDKSILDHLEMGM